jgi:hypothetical protein
MRKMKGSRRVVSDCCRMLMRAAALWVSESLCGRGLSKPGAASELKAPSLRMHSSTPRSVSIAFTCVSRHSTNGKTNTASSASAFHLLLYKSLPSQLLSINQTSTFSLTSQPDSSLIINNNFNHSSTINNPPTAIMSTDFGRKVCLLIHQPIMHIANIHPGSV